jgi:hypothetical protein
MDGTRALAHTIGGWRIHGLGIFRRPLFENAFALFDQYGLPRGVGVSELATRIVLFLARRVHHVDCLYHYRAHPNSLTSQFDVEWLGYLSNLQATLRFLRDVGQLDRLLFPYLTDSLNHSNYLFSLWNDPAIAMTDDERREGIRAILGFWSQLPKCGLLRYARAKRLPARYRIRLLLIAANLYPALHAARRRLRGLRVG